MIFTSLRLSCSGKVDLDQVPIGLQLGLDLRVASVRRRMDDRGSLMRDATAAPLSLTQSQFDALVVGLPWQRLPEMSVITRL